MCIQAVRRHMCRHCRTEWTHPDGVELCPEGDKIVLRHGYCAAVVEILERQGHHVSVARAVVYGTPTPVYREQGLAQYHHHHHQQQQPPPRQQCGASALYSPDQPQQQPSLSSQQQQQQPLTPNGTTTLATTPVNANGEPVMLDMCEDCKEKHVREWEAEMRHKQEEQERRQRERQQLHDA